MTEFLRGRRQTLTFGYDRSLGETYSILDEVFPARHDLAKCDVPLRVTFAAAVDAARE